ncbi:kinase-like protein [Acaromyces ingoldii]|uniref:non-specific serine/threonine protein kinase n=1 Tax=Acaromyces ingoldii TaxID=215250 RepID=A0A316YEH9_9BASI|nr:kinase-like protein [Acaromyces ingoldii]PWN87980.1 kinase-like protein [Acaromyces ingoldii]
MQQSLRRRAPGLRIAGDRFECIAVLGSSPFSMVYLARGIPQSPGLVDSFSSSSSSTSSQHNQFAIKCLDKISCDDIQRNCQKREASLHATVSHHPSVVTLLEVIDREADKYLYLVLEHCPDGDLFNMIAMQERYTTAWQEDTGSAIGLGIELEPDGADTHEQREGLQADQYNGNHEGQRGRQHQDEERARTELESLIKHVFAQIIDSVKYCHSQGIFHRDLKPENILCLEGGTKVVLADFGLATSETRSKDLGCGSAIYKSPDSFGGIDNEMSDYDTAANDVWALGVLLINLICRRNPWKQATMSDTTFREYVRRPDVLLDILPLSQQMYEVLIRVLTVHEDERCSLDELASMVDSLESFIVPDKVERRRPLDEPKSASMSPDPVMSWNRGRREQQRERANSKDRLYSRGARRGSQLDIEQAAEFVEERLQPSGEVGNTFPLIPVRLHRISSVGSTAEN